MRRMENALGRSGLGFFAGSLLVLVGTLASGCAAGGASNPAKPATGTQASQPAALESGFLPDYAKLQPSDQSPSVLVYRAPNLKSYRKVLFRPVRIWRSSDRRLDDIPGEDLQYLADALYRAMLRPLRKSFDIAREPGPGVLEVAVALTLVINKDEKIDSYTTEVPAPVVPERRHSMSDATRGFVQNCAVEVELSELLPKSKAHGKTGKPKRAVRVAFFDKRRGSESPKGSVKTWAELETVFERWANDFDGQLVALKDGTFHPKFTMSAAPKALAH